MKMRILSDSRKMRMRITPIGYGTIMVRQTVLELPLFSLYRFSSQIQSGNGIERVMVVLKDS